MTNIRKGIALVLVALPGIGVAACGGVGDEAQPAAPLADAVGVPEAGAADNRSAVPRDWIPGPEMEPFVARSRERLNASVARWRDRGVSEEVIAARVRHLEALFARVTANGWSPLGENANERARRLEQFLQSTERAVSRGFITQEQADDIVARHERMVRAREDASQEAAR